MISTLKRQRQRFMVVTVIGFAYVLAGTLSWSYPPDYLAHSKVWAALLVVGGLSAWATLFCRHVYISVGSGALLVGSALFRSVAIFTEVGWRDAWRTLAGGIEEPLTASFLIAGTTWWLIGVLIWFGWPQIQAGLLGSQGEQNE